MATLTPPMEWQNEGTKPSEELTRNGFVGGYKPAAGTFNYFLNNYYKCIHQLQAELVNVTGVGKSLAGKEVKPTHDTTVTAGEGAEIFNDYAERTYEGEIVTSGNVASGAYSHAEGYRTTASGDYSHAEGGVTNAIGDYSHAEGYKTQASGHYSHAEGLTTASGDYSHAEGYNTTASGITAHSEGDKTTASGEASHAEGYNTTASGNYSHAQNYETTASGTASHAGGGYVEAIGSYAFAHGYHLTASHYQAVFGMYNTHTAGTTRDNQTEGSVFVVGIGTGESTLKNGLRVSKAGRCYGASSFGAQGADYAEYFEWLDGNPDGEDRRGLFIALEGNKIRPATPNDLHILGAISTTPAIAGGCYADAWQGMYLKDVFGERLTEEVETEEGTETRFIINPKYDPEKEYVSREKRKEWGLVGTHGQLVVIDDGTCQVNSFCTVTDNGTATTTEDITRFRVIERIDDNHIRIFII